MQRLSCAPAVGLVVWAACGNVQSPPADASADAAPITPVITGSLLTGCVVALHMDEPSWAGGVPGEVKDGCGDDNPAMVQGPGATTVPNGAHGRAGSFSGSACLVIQNAAALHGTNGLTLSAWILPSQLNNDGGSTANSANGVISKRDDSTVNNEYSMSVWMKNNVYVDLDTNNDRFPSTAVIQEKVWTQLTLVYDGSQTVAAQRVRLFINGGLDSTHAETSASLAPFTSPLYIGCTPAPSQSTQQYFLGEMDEVVIWNRALSDAEIGQWYGATKPATP